MPRHGGARQEGPPNLPEKAVAGLSASEKGAAFAQYCSGVGGFRFRSIRATGPSGSDLKALADGSKQDARRRHPERLQTGEIEAKARRNHDA